MEQQQVGLFIDASVDRGTFSIIELAYIKLGDVGKCMVITCQ